MAIICTPLDNFLSIVINYSHNRWYGIPRSQLYDEILGVIYRSASYLYVQSHDALYQSTHYLLSAEYPDPGVSSLHAISVLYMVFALATLFDKDHPPYSYQAQEYFLLSRLALRCSSPLVDTTLWSIQSLVRLVVCAYFILSDQVALTDIPNDIHDILC